MSILNQINEMDKFLSEGGRYSGHSRQQDETHERVVLAKKMGRDDKGRRIGMTKEIERERADLVLGGPGSVKSEMTAIYNFYRKGDIPQDEAKTRVFILRNILDAQRTELLEESLKEAMRRLAIIEAQNKQQAGLLGDSVVTFELGQGAGAGGGGGYERITSVEPEADSGTVGDKPGEG